MTTVASASAPTAPVGLPAPPPEATYNLPPDDEEMWSYTKGRGQLFLQFSALSKLFLGLALVFLSLRGQWLLLLLPFAVMMVLGAIITMIWSTQLDDFDQLGHAQRVAGGPRTVGSVDVFITTCGEDPFVVEHTIWRAACLESDGPVRVYVLDDKGAPEVQRFAELWGATYLHRPNRGWMKKAGNIHYAYTRSSADFIVVLDADFAVRPDFLRNTLPYFDDESVGIVQTPQYFRVSRNNWVERGAAAQQEQFYRIGMRARDRRGGAICVGTNAVYRRAALDRRGGMALLEHSEDLFTGMKVLDAGYRVMYLPVVLAAGSAPENAQALASQQYRWARGNFALAGTPLFKRLKLTPLQRLSIWDGWIFYVTSALSPVVAVIVPLLTLAEAPEAISLAPTLMLLPALITEFVLQPRWLYLSDGQASRRVGLISQISHLYALRDHLTDREQEWVPTGGIKAGKHRQATDRIPDLVAAGGLWGFLATMAMLGLRVAGGYSALDLAPVGILAVVALPTALSVTRPPVRVLRVGARTDPERDSFLDTVRSLSIIRVLFWHTLGFWWISWTFAAMPAVFYVSGAVFAKSLAKRTPMQVMWARLRRLLPPYAVFIAVSIGSVAIAQPRSLRAHLVDAASWIVPVRSPAPLSWEEGWLSTPLWFLRALVLVLVLTPLAIRASRVVSGLVWGAIWATLLILIDVIVGHQTTEWGTAVWRGLGDLVCFGGFFAIGMAVHHRRHDVGRRERLRMLAAAVAMTAVATIVAPPPGMVVNNSNVSMALVGLCWLIALLLFEDEVRHVSSIPAVNRVLVWVSGRSMTIYLWHTLVICVTYYVVGMPASLGGYLVFAAVFVSLLAFMVATTHPFESIGSRGEGSPRMRVLPLLVWTITLLGLTSQPTLFPQTTEAIGPPAPSGRPAVGGGSDDVDVATPASGQAVSAEAWLQGQRVGSAAVALLGGPDDALRHAQLGADAMLDANAQFEVLSITKTMVAAAALQLVDDGALSLDAPLPRIEGLPTELTDSETLRRLLAHASGLVDYREARSYDPQAVFTPRDAVLMALPDSDTSVTTVTYSATNYIIAGLLVEQATGQSLANVLDERFFGPLGLQHTKMVDNTRAGFVGFASGGVVSTVDDVARWYDALVRRRVVLSPAMLDEMVWGGAAYTDGGGLGAWRHCPCTPPTAEDPMPWLYLFHDGGDVRVSYVPKSDTVVVIRLSVPLYGARHVVDRIDDLIFAVMADERDPTSDSGLRSWTSVPPS